MAAGVGGGARPGDGVTALDTEVEAAQPEERRDDVAPTLAAAAVEEQRRGRRRRRRPGLLEPPAAALSSQGAPFLCMGRTAGPPGRGDTPSLPRPGPPPCDQDVPPVLLDLREVADAERGVARAEGLGRRLVPTGRGPAPGPAAGTHEGVPGSEVKASSTATPGADAEDGLMLPRARPLPPRTLVARTHARPAGDAPPTLGSSHDGPHDLGTHRPAPIPSCPTGTYPATRGHTQTLTSGASPSAHSGPQTDPVLPLTRPSQPSTSHLLVYRFGFDGPQSS